MADISTKESSSIGSHDIGSWVDSFVQYASFNRKAFERRWYDNNFFDDGFHFRYVSRTTNKIVDLTDKAGNNMPMRAIPKASLQVRGIANLLLAPEYVPVIYPKKVTSANYQDPNQYQEALKVAKDVAKRTGNWLTKEWDNQDLDQKLVQMVLLAAKNYVSYIQVYPDAKQEKIRTRVLDAFDVYLKPDVTEVKDSPIVVIATPQLISQIKSNPNFDQEAMKQITPDNKYASSEIKNAYLLSKYGTGNMSDSAATLILKEAYIKEYLNKDNIEDYKEDVGSIALYEAKEIGDMVVRQVFTAGGVTLYDKYTTLEDHNIHDFRLEPGVMYGTSLIERFIPSNKSLDTIVSRIERYANTMVTGTWVKRKGENYEVSNIAGGQVLEYEQTKPEQAQMASIPGFVFNFIGLLNQFIDEQGATTAALGSLPGGIRSGVAIESLKQTEYANLKIASSQLVKTIKRIAKSMIYLADEHFVTPQTVTLLEEGQPTHFDIIGNRGFEARKLLKVPVTGEVTPISKDCEVDIQVEKGLGFTTEGKRAAMKDVIDFMQVLAQQQLISQDAINIVAKKFLELYEFGATAEFMDAQDQPTKPLEEQQLTQMKVAILEALQEAGEVGNEATEKRIMESKIGVIEALQEAGVLDEMGAKEVSEKLDIPYKEAPEDVKRQMEEKAGFQPSRTVSPRHMEQISKMNNAGKGANNGQQEKK